jgi:hypothetical protein
MKFSTTSLTGFDSQAMPSKKTARIGGRRQSRWLRTADGFAVS